MIPFNRITSAVSAALSSFRQAWLDQGTLSTRHFQKRVNYYDRLWEYYSNNAFENLDVWSEYKRQHGLYRYIRQIYNPTARLVEFYTTLYPGVLTTDAKRVPDGTPLAIPLARDTSPELRSAIGSFWEMSNWQEQMHVMLRYAAALGNVLVKINDEVDRGRVSAQVVWPGLISDIELDTAGNVQRYVLEYDIEDEDGGIKLYREEVDKEKVSITLDDKPYNANGMGSTYANPYGFVPACWLRFNNLGSVYGAPVTWHSIGKIDELNNLASQTHDQINKMLESPIMVKGGKNVRTLQDLIGSRKTQPTADDPDPYSSRDSLDILYGPPDAGLETLSFDVSQAMEAIEGVIKELENDFPELSVFNVLRQMTQTTGPAVEKLSSDVKSRFTRTAAAADRQTVKLIQMGLAIGGWRANTGAWTDLTRKQEVFKPFSLDSYKAGDLDFDIDMRPLLPDAKGEVYTVEASRWTAFQQALNAGAPLEFLLRDDGWDETRITEFIKDCDGPVAKKLQEIKDSAMAKQTELQKSLNSSKDSTSNQTDRSIQN
jgi:hypothetical protein